MVYKSISGVINLRTAFKVRFIYIFTPSSIGETFRTSHCRLILVSNQYYWFEFLAILLVETLNNPAQFQSFDNL